MTSASNDESIVDAERLLAVGENLLKTAYELPEPPEPLPVIGTDALSLALAARTAEVEQPLIAGLAATRQRMIDDAQDMIRSARAVLDQPAASIEETG